MNGTLPIKTTLTDQPSLIGVSVMSSDKIISFKDDGLFVCFFISSRRVSTHQGRTINLGEEPLNIAGNG